MDISPPPSTAREVLAAFFPKHSWHTAVATSTTPHTITLTCVCSTKNLRITNDDARKKAWTMDQIGHALRNTPTTKRRA